MVQGNVHAWILRRGGGGGGGGGGGERGQRSRSPYPHPSPLPRENHKSRTPPILPVMLPFIMEKF